MTTGRRFDSDRVHTYTQTKNMLYIISTLSVLCIGFLIYALYKSIVKIESLEDFIFTRETEIIRAVETMETIDRSGAFEADDEVGVAFTQLKEITDGLQEQYDD